MPVKLDVIQYLRGRTGTRTTERTSWGHSGRRKKSMVTNICSRYCADGGQRRGSKKILKRFKKFLKEAELELSTEKTKIVVFEKKEQKETKKMEMGRAGIRRSGREKIPGVHTTGKRQR